MRSVPQAKRSSERRAAAIATAEDARLDIAGERRSAMRAVLRLQFRRRRAPASKWRCHESRLARRHWLATGAIEGGEAGGDQDIGQGGNQYR